MSPPPLTMATAAGHENHEAHDVETIRPTSWPASWRRCRSPSSRTSTTSWWTWRRSRIGGRCAGPGFTEEEIAEGETLLGWFDPLELPTAWSGDAVNVHDMLHRLVIYKRPLEEEFPERKRLLTEIRKTVIHELAHHFGWTDADLEKFDDNPDPFGDGFNDLQ